MFDSLKAAILKSFKDEDRSKASKWIQSSVTVFLSVVCVCVCVCVCVQVKDLSYFQLCLVKLLMWRS